MNIMGHLFLLNYTLIHNYPEVVLCIVFVSNSRMLNHGITVLSLLLNLYYKIPKKVAL